ncbi:hypothetical protein [Oricola sp.]|uniref:hypothetical protein n=1 Tax=Oricola sp. TaxID=1979950 RepID=UPI003BA918F7
MNDVTYGRILRLEGLLLTAAGLAHLVYCALFLDWSVQPLVANLGALAFGVAYTFLGAQMALGRDRLLPITLIINICGFVAVMVAGENSPLIAIDPYLVVVDLISIPTLIWLNIMKRRDGN